MATVTFYEKPGCRGNARQRAILEASGHEVETVSILTHPWTAETLRPFFAGLPVAAWFNPSAPKVSKGEVRPEALDAETALALLSAEPILIRRPLMESGGRRMAGWEPGQVDGWIGLAAGLDPAVCCGRHNHDDSPAGHEADAGGSCHGV
ncbi:MAG: ArsC/Spx/MgsR family protein [Rhodospirillaceae bacterium]